MDFLDEKINRYAEEHTAPESDLLTRINRDTYSQVLMPRMLSGHLQGRVLSTYSRMIKPKLILEIGTYTGYSAICLAEGLQEGGKLITVEINSEIEERTRSYFNQSPFADNIDFRIGDATKIVPELDKVFDLVFIDADKENYGVYYDLIFSKVRTGGFIIVDNVLWSGKVLDGEVKDPETQSIKEFNLMVKNDPRIHPVLFPIRDGLMVIQKIKK